MRTLIPNKNFSVHLVVLFAFAIFGLGCKNDGGKSNSGAGAVQPPDQAPPNQINLHTLTVVNGFGSGKYSAGASVTVTANTAPRGEIFNVWIGPVTNPQASSSLMTMPASDVIVTATYQAPSTQPRYSLSVVNGSGSGSYTAGTVVTITANPSTTGQLFVTWTGMIVANPTSPTTTLMMPAITSAVTATYSDSIHCSGIYLNANNDVLNFTVGPACAMTLGGSTDSCQCTYIGNSVTISQCSPDVGSSGGTFSNSCQNVNLNGLNFTRH